MANQFFKSIAITVWAVSFLMSSAHPGLAAQFVTILDTTINVEKIEFIEPTFCSTPYGQVTPPYSAIDFIGTCSFVIVFGSADFSITTNKNGYSASSATKDKLEIKVNFDDDTQVPGEVVFEGRRVSRPVLSASARSKPEALKVLRSFRDVLPK